MLSGAVPGLARFNREFQSTQLPFRGSYLLGSGPLHFTELEGFMVQRVRDIWVQSLARVDTGDRVYERPRWYSGAGNVSYLSVLMPLTLMCGYL